MINKWTLDKDDIDGLSEYLINEALFKENNLKKDNITLIIIDIQRFQTSKKEWEDKNNENIEEFFGKNLENSIFLKFNKN